MRETQENIKKYKEQLTHVKSKIAAAGLFFVMSIAMLTTASFAWIVLSTSPEVSGISTTVSGNGNLEIALAGNVDENGDLIQPNESTAQDGQLPILEKNITWGNLINLSDDSYGLNNATLRPSILNRGSILKSPLKAVQYAPDGRVFGTTFQFSYANWDKKEERFLIPPRTRYGVRAISSVTYTSSSEDLETYLGVLNELLGHLDTAKSKYKPINTETYLKSIANIMGAYLTDRFNPSEPSLQNPTINKNDISNLLKIITLLKDSQNELANVFLQIANKQIELKGLNFGPYKTLEQLVADGSTLEENGIVLRFVKEDPIDYKTLLEDIEILEKVEERVKTLSSNGTTGVKLKEIIGNTETGDKKIYGMNDLVEISTCVVYVDMDGDGIKEANTIDKLGSYGTGQLIQLNNNTYKATIFNGVLARFEHLLGGTGYDLLKHTKLPIQAKKKVGITATATVYADISTASSDQQVGGKQVIPNLIGDAQTKDPNSVYGILLGNADMLATAADIYGMTIDFWVRTNVEDSYLILEGEPQIEYLPMKNSDGYLVYEDIDGNLFYHKPTSTVSDPSHDDLVLYQQINKETEKTYFQEHNPAHLANGDFYSYTTGQLRKFVKLNEQGNEVADSEARAEFVSSLINYAIKTKVVGYDGVNRVWEESTDLTNGTSVTQGKGSCFIFQSSDPLEQESMMRVLSALSVSFIDSFGNELATATLNTEKAYAEAGKVTVPLELNSTSSSIEKDGEKTYYIAPLTQNEAQLISAIVYIDGELISNKDVSATRDVNGYLNLQFGSTVELNSIIDEELQNSAIKLSASVDKTIFNENEIPGQTTLSVGISGINASKVEAYFSRKVNELQGVRLEPTILTLVDGSGKGTTWSGIQEFNTPGTYVLNSIWIDGIEYDLPRQLDSNGKLKDAISIEVKGFNINEINWKGFSGKDEVYIMSSDSSFSVDLEAKVSFSDILNPKQIEALFINEYNEYVSINLTQGLENWSGTGKFITSGKYELQFLRVDGEIYAISDNMKKELHLSLGVYADVHLDENKLNFTFEPNEADAAKNNVNITNVKILDNKDNPLEAMSDIWIEYGIPGAIDPLKAQLTWNESKDCYEGVFKIQGPGNYSFRRITVGIDSSVNKATGAPDINVMSPYPISFVENSLEYDDYVFAPDKDANMSVQIKDSFNSNKVIALFEHDKDDIEGNGNETTHYITGKFVSGTIPTWTFTPTCIDADTQEEIQDGKWTIKEIYVSDAFYDDDWYSSTLIVNDPNTTIDETTLNWYEVPANRVLWDVEDKSMYVLSQMNVSVNNTFTVDENGKEIDFEGPFTDALSGAYYGTNYSILYKNYFGETLDTTSTSKSILNLNSYGVSIKSNSLVYSYANGLPAWLEGVSTHNTAKEAADAYNSNELSKDIVSFNKGDKVEFKYPGTYSPILSLEFDVKDDKGTVLTTVSVDANVTGKFGKTQITEGNANSGKLISNNFINVKNIGLSRTVSWDRPDVKFNDIKFDYYTKVQIKSFIVPYISTSEVNASIPLGTIFPTKKGNGTTLLNTDYNRILDEGKTAKMFSYVTKDLYDGRLADYDGVAFTSPKANLVLSNVDGNAIGGASVTINDPTNAKYSKTFSFASKSLISNYEEMGDVQTDLQASASSIGTHTNRTSDGSSATQVTITYNNVNYTFGLNGNLVVDYDY